MFDKPIDPNEVKALGETYRQLDQEQIEENAEKLLNLAEEGGESACRDFYAGLKTKGYQSLQITEITLCATQKLQQRLDEASGLDSTAGENN